MLKGLVIWLHAICLVMRVVCTCLCISSVPYA